jgi:pectinesterase
MGRRISALVSPGQAITPCLLTFHANYICSTSSYESNTVTLTYNGAKATKGSDDASGTLRVHANSFAMYNIKVVNTYGPGNGVGSQALALSAYGTKQVSKAYICFDLDDILFYKGFYGCSFVGYQDTLYTNKGTQYFGHSYIEGAVGESRAIPLRFFHFFSLTTVVPPHLSDQYHTHIYTDFIFGKTANTYIRSSVIASVIAGSTITAPGPPSSGAGICKASSTLYTGTPSYKLI